MCSIQTVAHDKRLLYYVTVVDGMRLTSLYLRTSINRHKIVFYMYIVKENIWRATQSTSPLIN